jgi:hypothetical protein
MNKITVAGQLINKTGITLFLADGTSRVLPQDSWQTKEVLAAIMPQLAKNEMAKIDLDSFAVEKKLAAVAPGVRVKDKADGSMSVEMSNGKIKSADGLRSHMERAVYGGGHVGFNRFMGYVNESLRRRRYSIDELMVFLKGADLPIADDGTILGFKILNEQDKDGTMTDHHSGRVKQRLGSLVYMPNSKVDQSRALCSTGLHIAARGYLSGFWGHRSGSALCLVKIKPGDVVSVPQGETSKMRVSAYHIVKVFSKEDGQKIVNGSNIEDLPTAAKMLAEAVVGNHEPILERVKVTGYGDIEVTKNEKAKPRVLKKLRPIADISRRVDPTTVKAEFKAMQSKTFMSRIAGAFGFGKKEPVVVVNNHTTVREYVVQEDEVETANNGHAGGASWSQEYAPEAIEPAEKLPELRPQPQNSVQVGDRPVIKKAKKGKAVKIDATYAKKLVKAQAFHDKGKSIRWIATKLKMDRESLGKNLIRKAA